MNPKLSFFILFILGFFTAFSQANSPFSRYGLGDPYPSQNIINRGMGGIATTYSNSQSVGFSNPATYSDLKIVTYDIGISVDSRSLKSAEPVLKYTSVNLSPAYVALGMPLSKKNNLGLAFGLRPLSNVSYSIEDNRRISADSINYVYEGDGGLYQAFVGIGKRWGGLKLGFNTGYMFGRKQSSTLTTPVDSVYTYRSNSQTLATFNKIFFNAGLQYDARLSKNATLRFGFSGSLKQKLNAERQISRETFTYDENGAMTKVDSIYQSAGEKGKIELPVSYAAGISLNTSVSDKIGNKFDKSILAVEYETTQWANYRYFGQSDKLGNSWQFKVGGQLTPDPLSIRSYWNRVAYRAGFYYGKEALNADGNQLPVYALTLGMGLPIRKWSVYDNQYTIINTTIELGRRGNNKNNITENFFRLSFGLNLSDVWFKKRRYD
jgi:hypothetical protein